MWALKKSYKVNDKIITSTFKNINKMSSKDFIRRDGVKFSAWKNGFWDTASYTQTPRNVPQPSIKMVL